MGQRAAQSRPGHGPAPSAYSHRLSRTLADPLEIAQLTALEYLEIGPAEWRVLLDAGAVPRSLSAAAVKVHGSEDVLPVVSVANEILALWDRPRIIQTVVRGDLGPRGG